MEKISIIKGGWKNVPEHLKCKTELLQMGLVPKNKNKPSALVWNSYNWISLYNVAECRPKREPSQQQIENLRKGREKLKKLVTCSRCGSNVFFKRNMKGNVCKFCYEDEIAEREQENVRKQYKKMIYEGKELFKKWFYEDFIILDTETTGLYDAEIVELGIIDKGGNILFESLFRTKQPIPEEVIKIHGITNEMVATAPSWADKWNEVKQILTNRKILIYNSAFDVSIIENTCSIWGIDNLPKLETECVMEAFRYYHGWNYPISLANASGCYTSHRSIDDCFSVLELLNDVWKQLGLLEGDEYEDSVARNA
ncbi:MULTISPECIES: 3'-5' exonuclease [Bacillati]|uniref:3'-5' exonuclease n=1 Tax=Bacillati TaxID=1783272 RepID=UPI0022B9735E|nr:3'-5' exonuclease [Caldifermentibacillus hisashii]